MDQHFFRIPFAANGDKQNIPDAVNNEGYVSFTQGYGEDYAKDPTADAHAKPVERETMNFVLNAITGAMRQYQTHGYPQWITTADNNGAAFGYDAGVVVIYNGALYLSLVAANTATPGSDITKWQPYIQREATEAEALEGTGSTQSMTPRRVKRLASNLDEQLAEELKKQITPVTVPVGGAMLWFTSVPPEGWLEGNGQAFDQVKNPKLKSVYPSGRVPDCRDSYIYAGNGSLSFGSRVAEGSLAHYHHTGYGYPSNDDMYPIYRGNKGHQSLPTFGVHGEGNRLYAGQFPITPSWPGTALTGTTDPVKTDNTAGMPQIDPRRIVAMVIIKTDQAEAEEGEAAPSAIILTPATVEMKVGGTQQFTATVLPSSLAGNYPVSWSVSDSSLGSISSTGLYTATGVAGTQTIIASISTGLASTSTVTQSIWLTSINIGAIPDELISGERYDIAITYSPDNFTENVIAASSDNSVATLTSSGTLTVSTGGTTTLSLTGAQSGVTASVVVTTKEGVGDEVYLQIANNLSEIAASGEEAQEESRDNLGLGKLATHDSLSAGEVGAVPLASISLPSDLNLNDLTTPGEYFQNVSSNATLEKNYPLNVAGAIKVIATGVDPGACRQFYYPYDDHDEYRRYAYGDPLVFSEWVTIGDVISDVINGIYTRR
jgi:hypothetical protein